MGETDNLARQRVAEEFAPRQAVSSGADIIDIPLQRRDASVASNSTELEEWTPFSIEGRNYFFEGKLGEGGFGEVYKLSEDRGKFGKGREVAIKVFKQSLFSDDDMSEQFERELRTHVALAEIQPYIVQVFEIVDVVRDGEKTKGVIMQYMEDGDLGDVIQDVHKEQKAEHIDSLIASVGLQACTALEGIHKQGLVHRDIKPANLFIDISGQFIKLGDMGTVAAMERVVIEKENRLSKEIEENIPYSEEYIYQTPEQQQIGTEDRRPIIPVSDPDHLVGTLVYISPDLLMGKKAHPTDDLYSLGVTLYQMKTGEYPVGLRSDKLTTLISKKLTEEPIPIVNQMEPGYVPNKLDELIMTLITRDKEERQVIQISGEIFKLDTARGVINALRAAAKDGGFSAESFGDTILDLYDVPLTPEEFEHKKNTGMTGREELGSEQVSQRMRVSDPTLRGKPQRADTIMPPPRPLVGLTTTLNPPFLKKGPENDQSETQEFDTPASISQKDDLISTHSLDTPRYHEEIEQTQVDVAIEDTVPAPGINIFSGKKGDYLAEDTFELELGSASKKIQD